MSVALTIARLNADGTPNAGTVVQAIPDIRSHYRRVGGVWVLQAWLPLSATTGTDGTCVLVIPDPDEVRPALGWTIRLSPAELWHGRFAAGDTSFASLSALIAARGFRPVSAPPVEDS